MTTPLEACPDPNSVIDLGALSDFKYKLYMTNAPVDYDYSDTINVFEYKGKRLILLPDDEFKQNYQIGRYASGMKVAVDVSGKKYLMQMAMKRIQDRIKGLADKKEA